MTKQHGVWWQFGCMFCLAIMLVGCGGGSDDKGDETAERATNDTKKSAPIKLESQTPAEPQVAKALAAIEIDFDRFQRSSMGVLMGENQLRQLAGASGQEAEVLMSLKRIKVYLDAPQNLQTVMGFVNPAGGPPKGSALPFDFRAEVEFNSADAAADLMNQIKTNLQEVTLGQSTMYLPDSKQTGEPPIYYQIVSDTKLNLGSKNYMKSATVPLTDTAKRQWGQLPAGDFRLVVDMDSGRSFFSELAGMIRQNTPTKFAQFVDVIDQASYVGFAVDGNSDQLIHLSIQGHDANEAEKIKNSLAAVLDQAVQSSQGQLAQIRQFDPKGAEVFTKIMESMTPSLNGSSVAVTVQKPDGFDQVMRESVGKARERADFMQGLNDFKQLALSVHNFHDTFRRFPWAADPNFANESISWRVLVLPFLEQMPLYEQFDIKANWDADSNLAAAERMPEIFGKEGNLASVVSIKLEKQPKTFAEITDGTSNTIMLIETTTPVPWTKAGGITIDEAIDLVSSLEDGRELRVVFYDGSVRTINNKLSADDLTALLDPRDGKGF